MINANIFLCDVYGTISCDDNSTLERKTNVEKFIEYLVRLKKINIDDVLIFSLLTTEKFEYSKRYYYELLCQLNKSEIVIGPFFTEDKVLYNNHEIIPNRIYSKLEYQLEYIKYLIESQKYKIKKIYYAEDSNINIQIFLNLINKLYSNIECITFMPNEISNDCMKDTNKVLYKHITKI